MKDWEIEAQHTGQAPPGFSWETARDGARVLRQNPLPNFLKPPPPPPPETRPAVVRVLDEVVEATIVLAQMLDATTGRPEARRALERLARARLAVVEVVEGAKAST